MPDRYTPRQMIEKLVSFDTTSHLSNLELVSFVEDYLAPYGARLSRVPSPDGQKSNLIASIGPDVEGGIVLSGHTDVVPVEGQPWDTDPFTIVEKDGKLFGRGTCDMKSFSAIGLALLPEFLERGLKVPLHFALSYDEEVGCHGAKLLAAQMAETIPAPRCVIIGEPTDMKVVRANKGIRAFQTTVTGKESHSSLPSEGASAIFYAMELIQHLAKLRDEAVARGDSTGLFDPPFTTLSVGTIEGGTAMNITPRECSFMWEYRPLPQEDPDGLRDQFMAFAEQQVLPRLVEAAGAEASIITEDVVNVPGLEYVPDNAAEELAIKLTGANHTEVVSYAAEGGIFNNVGYRAVICGPGSIEQAHKPNEFITLEQVDLSIKFFRDLMDEVCD